MQFIRNFLFPYIESEEKRLKHFIFMSFNIFFFALGVMNCIFALHYSENRAIFIYAGLIGCLFAVFAVIFVRKHLFYTAFVYLSILWIANSVALFLFGGLSTNAVMFIVLSTLATIVLQWYIGGIMAIISIAMLGVHSAFSQSITAGVISYIPNTEFIRFSIILNSLFFLFLIYILSIHVRRLHTTLNRYSDEFSIRLEAEKKIVTANNELNGMNSLLEEKMTELKRSNTSLTTALEKAEESDRLKSAFLANISHEIRTPLNAIVGFSSLLNGRLQNSDKTSKKYVDLIDESSSQLLNIVTDIIEISQLEAGVFQLNSDVFELDEVIEEVVNSYSKVLSIKKINLTIEKNGVFPSKQIATDKAKISRIFAHLFSNAVKFTHTGAIIVTIRSDKNQITIAVRDTGIGIAKEYQELVFDRFRQVELGAKRNYGGLGIGLSLVKGLIEFLEGSVDIESELGKGSIFTVSFPVNFVKDEADGMNQNIVNEDIKCVNFLVAEDEDINFNYVKEILAKLRGRVYHAYNGQEAVDIFEKEKIDLILMDIKMPIMDGIEAFEKIKAQNPKIPIIAVTAFATPTDNYELIRKGFDGFVSKPYNAEKLIKTINYLVKTEFV